MRGRNKTYKYKNYLYPSHISNLLKIPLSNDDLVIIDELVTSFLNSNLNRGYQYIIKDLYILTIKQELTTTQLSEIYDVNIRTVQIWLKELGLNRTLKAAKSISRKNSLTNSSKINFSNEPVKKSYKEKVNNDLPFFISDFLNYLETIRGKSPNTILGYKIDLTLFFRFMKIYKNHSSTVDLELEEILINDLDIIFLKEIVLTDIYAFLAYVEKNRNNSSYARARKVATLKSFYKFLVVKAKLITDNPTVDLESPKINKRHPIYLSLDQSVYLLRSLDKTATNYYRDYCILTLFLNCGMRLSELCTIEINKIKNDTLTIIGKGSKERTIYLNNACMKSIENYFKVRDTSKATDVNKNYLFLSNRSLPINKRTVELLVKKHIKNAQIDDHNYTPHKLRHTAATLMYKHGNVDIRSLQSILGHENISTTQIYTHIDDDNLRQAVNSNPLSKL